MAGILPKAGGLGREGEADHAGGCREQQYLATPNHENSLLRRVHADGIEHLELRRVHADGIKYSLLCQLKAGFRVRIGDPRTLHGKGRPRQHRTCGQSYEPVHRIVLLV
jgi:hypothetical protein